MNITNGEDISENTKDALIKYYSDILENNEKFYCCLPSKIRRTERKIKNLENKIEFVDRLANILDKFNENILFEMYVGYYADDFSSYIDDSKEKLMKLYRLNRRRIMFYESYTNLLENGICIYKDSDSSCVVMPHDGKINFSLDKNKKK